MTKAYKELFNANNFDKSTFYPNGINFVSRQPLAPHNCRNTDNFDRKKAEPKWKNTKTYDKNMSIYSPKGNSRQKIVADALDDSLDHLAEQLVRGDGQYASLYDEAKKYDPNPDFLNASHALCSWALQDTNPVLTTEPITLKFALNSANEAILLAKKYGRKKNNIHEQYYAQMLQPLSKIRANIFKYAMGKKPNSKTYNKITTAITQLLPTMPSEIATTVCQICKPDMTTKSTTNSDLWDAAKLLLHHRKLLADDNVDITTLSKYVSTNQNSNHRSHFKEYLVKTIRETTDDDTFSYLAKQHKDELRKHRKAYADRPGSLANRLFSHNNETYSWRQILKESKRRGISLDSDNTNTQNVY